MDESQGFTQLAEHLFDDPEHLSQLLRQRAGSNHPIHFSTSTESHQSGIAAPVAAAATSIDIACTIAPHLAHAPSARRVTTATNYAKPVLHTTRSAPTSTGPLVEREGVQRMYQSFTAGMDIPGDTQPDSQMHKNVTSSIRITEESIIRSAPRSLFVEHVEEEEEEEGDGASEGEPAAASSQERPTTNTSPTVLHEDDDVGPLPQHSYAATSPLKFETPAFAGRKRDNSGQFLSSAARTNTTPGTVASASAFAFPGFGNAGAAGISLTQAWNNTQAPTSPIAENVAEAAAEDAAFERPSPNFTNVRPSSPMLGLSSPIKAIQPETPQTDPPLRSSIEPQTEYISMKESQERRRKQAPPPPALVHEDSWEQPSAAQIRHRKMKARQDFDRVASMSFATVSAPLAISSPVGKVRVGDGPSLQGKSRKSRPKARRILSESAFTVETPRWNTNEPEDDSSLDQNVQVPNTSSHNLRIPPSPTASPSLQIRHETRRQRSPSSSRVHEGSLPPSSRESVAIMDSQPDATANYDSIPRPKSLRYPSSPSMNQYSINQTVMGTKTGYTSQIVSSSMPAMPPRSSSEAAEVVPQQDEERDGDDRRVPSSPPVVSHEDEITYDEHEKLYDEYDEGCGDEEVQDSADQGPEEDEEMATKNHLPVVKMEQEVEEYSELEDENDENDNANEGEEADLTVPSKVDSEMDPSALQAYANHEVAPDSEQQEGVVHEPYLPMEPPRMRRQDTVPETDAIDETQPSFFPNEDLRGHNCEHTDERINGANSGKHTNGTEPYHTAQEQISRSQSKQLAPSSSKGDGSDTLDVGNRLKSLQDIYDLPDTQPSNGEDLIEMPHLDGLDEKDDSMQGQLSPARPAAKRRKIKHTGKRTVFQTPTKAKPATNEMFDQLRSPLALENEQPNDSGQPDRMSKENDAARMAAPTIQSVDDITASPVKAAILKSKAPTRQRKPSKKQGSLKPVTRELFKSLSSPGNSPVKPRSPANEREASPMIPTKQHAVEIDGQNDIEMNGQTEESGESANRNSEPVADETGSSSILLPNRIFASWPGSHYYPATCTGRASGRLLNIRFDEGNTTTIDATHVRALDLRPGDYIKVDGPGMKKYVYEIVGFKDRIDDLAGEEFPATDQRGYATVVVKAKQRVSHPDTKIEQPEEHISVPISSIYITAQLWTRLRDRIFHFPSAATPSKPTSRIGTPIALAEVVATPSFFRKSITVPLVSTTRAGSVASSSAFSGSGAFSNMAFVLTSTAAEVDKDTIARLIKSNGGRVLEHGFHELFDLDTDGSPPSSTGQHDISSASSDSIDLKLKRQYQDLGFVALISDSFSRSTKYIQALALNVPCLHLRWIQDSLSASRAVTFAKYLLPAGVSKFLDPTGVVRSRTMTTYDPSAEDVSFARTVAGRDFLLRNQSVLLVTGKSKKEIEKRQPFVFLSHALGSASVGRCADLPAAKNMLASAEWDWIYVDSGDMAITDAAAELFATTKSAAAAKPKKGGKKRKRDAPEERESLVARGSVKGRTVRVTSAEFVIQSLILGALVEE